MIEVEVEAEVRLIFDKTFCYSFQRSQRTRDGYTIPTHPFVPRFTSDQQVWLLSH